MDGEFNIASISCLSMLFSKISGTSPDTFEKNTSSTLAHRPFLGALSMITPRIAQKPTPNQAGDIYYSTLLRFVKRFSEDFSKILRTSTRPITPQTHRNFFTFEENTGLFQNRYHIKYTQNPTLSSPVLQKSKKNRDGQAGSRHGSVPFTRRMYTRVNNILW